MLVYPFYMSLFVCVANVLDCKVKQSFVFDSTEVKRIIFPICLILNPLSGFCGADAARKCSSDTDEAHRHWLLPARMKSLLI